jgi:hypothetical protein
VPEDPLAMCFPNSGLLRSVVVGACDVLAIDGRRL